VVVACVSLSEKIEADPQEPKRAKERRMVPPDDLDWESPLFLGSQADWRSMTVRPRHYENPVPFQPLITRENIGGQIHSRDVPYVQWAIGIWPRNPDENVFVHEYLR
jgi:hypothetical protein